MDLRDALYGDNSNRPRQTVRAAESVQNAARLAQERARVRELLRAERRPGYRFPDERRDAAVIEMLDDLDGGRS